MSPQDRSTHRPPGHPSLISARGLALLAATGAALTACGHVSGASHSAAGAAGHDATDGTTDPGASGPTGEGASRSNPTLGRLHLPAVAPGSALPGYMLIADRENNRIIIVSPAKAIVWQFPGPRESAAAQQFLGPDDAFLTPDARNVTTNEENSETVAVVTLDSHPHIVWRYGHLEVPGSESGYLYHPDDAYMLPNGLISVADIVNCRVIWLDHAGHIVRQLGTTGECEHRPPSGLDLPNGDTPLPDGGVLVTEIGGWIDRFGPSGHLVWSIKTPAEYPSDAQLLPEGRVLVAGYNQPGKIYVIDPQTQRVVWSYGPPSGAGSLDHPSLALLLPNGMIAATDDWDHRVVIIDRATKRIVWEYGHDGVAGVAPGYLNTPDGLDLVP